MKGNRISIIAAILIISSCQIKHKDPYPNNRSVSTQDGTPTDSLAFYFPTRITLESETIATNLDTFLLKWYSSALYAAHEPVLFNSYLGHDVYRLLLLTPLPKPFVFSFHKEGSKVWITRKQLDKQPEFQETSQVKFENPQQIQSVSRPDRKASIEFHQTKQLTEQEWKEFESLLYDCAFWSLTPVDEMRGLDGIDWIIEAHLENKYWFVQRWSPEDKFRKAGAYLIEKSGLNPDQF